MKHILIAFGTRPEAIKLAPVINELKAHCKVTVLHSGQHKDLVEPMLELFEIEPDINLKIMQPGQDLFELSERLLPKLREALTNTSPDFVMVQGDTTTAYLTALAAFYMKIPVLHVEAGLRSHNTYYPFPEEMNRKQISNLAHHHFAPTPLNKQNLLNEGISEEQITVTGNTVIDALLHIKQSKLYGQKKPEILSKIGEESPVIVLTAHRRENHGEPLVRIFEAVKQLIAIHDDLLVIFPIHPNPAVQKALDEAQISNPRFLQTPPFDYLSFLHILNRANLILTDSGGIQEEAAALGKPVLVLRGETERQELIESGMGELVGSNTDQIIERAGWHLANSMGSSAQDSNIYGDGTSAQKIRKTILGQL